MLRCALFAYYTHYPVSAVLFPAPADGKRRFRRGERLLAAEQAPSRSDPDIGFRSGESTVIKGSGSGKPNQD